MQDEKSFFVPVDKTNGRFTLNFNILGGEQKMIDS